MKPRTTCPDCSGAMGSIHLLEKSGGMSQHDTRYAAGDAKPSRFMHTLTDTGTVRAFMCSDCGLIRLYGDPDAA
jgi:hypothetical protein